MSKVDRMTSKLDQKLDSFRQKFIVDYQEELANIVAFWRVARAEKTAESLNDFTFAVHKLKGSSGALNFLNLSDRLAIIEAELHGTKSGASQFTNSLKALIDSHINALIASAKKSPDLMLKVVQRDNDASIATPSDEALNKKESSNVRATHIKGEYTDISIALIDGDAKASDLLLRLLRSFGFTVAHFHTIEEFEGEKDSDYDLILLDLALPEIPQEQVFEFATAQGDKGSIVFILSTNNSFEARLAGVRAKVSEYLLRPVNITTLVSKIRNHFKADTDELHKILLLDDQNVIRDFYKALFEGKGVEVRALSDPSKLMDTLESFHPDVFLLDMHMPNVTGIEVAKLLRQQPKYDYVPIVFLTADTDLQTKLLALECGADDLIPKDTSPNVIVHQLESRISRGQEIRYLASRDSLTGVLNHGQIMEAAGHAFTLSHRTNSPVTLCMIDLDNFKQVNDNYGHSGGDKVLVSLGQLLMQSLRETDYVGRYGGEEFMVVLNDSDDEAIETKLNEMREAFNQITFSVNGQSFHCSFSAGVANSAHYGKVNDLISAADAALYQAKEKGKNRVGVDGDL